MHGVTRPITLHVKLVTHLTNVAAAELQRTRWDVTTESLKRRDFGLLFGSTAEAVSGIGQDVATKIEVEAVRSH